MWLLMYACYLMAVLTYVLFVLSGLQGIFGFAVLGAPHPTFSFLTAIIYLFTQTLTIFFFVGTGTNVREYLESQQPPPNGSEQLIARARAIRGAASGQIYLNILLFLVQAILGGAVAARAVPRFLHGTLVAVAFLHFHYVLWREHLAFRDMTAVVVAMADPDRAEEDAN